MITKILGMLLLGACLLTVYLFETASGFTGLMRIFHWPAIILTAIGPIGTVLMSTEWGTIRETLRSLVKDSPRRLEKEVRHESQLMQQTTHQIYRLGTKALDRHLQEKLSPTLRKVFRRISARVPLIDIVDLVERERDRVHTELLRQLRVVSLGLRLAPSVGMLGTILGMVQLLSHLQDPSNIGTHMSLALLTTFYGLFFSIAFWNPLHSRLESIIEAKLHAYDRVLHWLEIMDERKPIQYFEDQLKQNEEPAKVAKPAPEKKAEIKTPPPKFKVTTEKSGHA